MAKRMTKRMVLAAVTSLVGVVFTTAYAITGKTWFEIGSVVALFGVLLIGIDAVERGNILGFRKLERVNKNISKQLNDLRLKANSAPSDVSRNERDDLRSQNRELMQTLQSVSSYVSEREHLQSSKRKPTPSQLDSIRELIEWAEPTTIYCSYEWRSELSDVEKVPFESGDVPANIDKRRPMILVDIEDISNLHRQLLSSPGLRQSIVVLRKNAGSNFVESLKGFKEIAPVPVLFGVQCFYPEQYVSDKKFSKLLSYQ